MLCTLVCATESHSWSCLFRVLYLCVAGCIHTLYVAWASDSNSCSKPCLLLLALETICLLQMGVHRVYLDASNKLAKDKWLSPAMGFTQISDQEHEMLVMQYSLVENDGCAARCLKLIPTKAALLDKVSPEMTTCRPCPTLPCDRILCASHNYTSTSTALGKFAMTPTAAHTHTALPAIKSAADCKQSSMTYLLYPF